MFANNYLFLLTFLFFSRNDGVDYANLSGKIVNEFSKEIYYSHKIAIYGSGGALGYDVNTISLSLSCPCYQMNIENARRLYVNLMNNLLYKYNSDKSIRPYLRNYPFTIKNIRMSISFEDSKGKYLKGENLAYVSAYMGEIEYCGFDYEKNDFYTIHEEPFEKALELLQK